MAKQAVLIPQFPTDGSPYVGALANKIAARAGDSAQNANGISWSLLAEVLTFAAEAEQRLAEQRRRISELEALSATDELTGLANRRGFEEFLHRTLAAAKRHKEEGVLLFVDLDDFKTLNDRYGHEVGDAALKTVADTLSAQVRTSDLVARWGGDEFVIVLVRCPARMASDRAADLESVVRTIRVRHKRRIIPVTASCGFATFGPESTAEEVLSHADKMMYTSKLGKQGQQC